MVVEGYVVFSLGKGEEKKKSLLMFFRRRRMGYVVGVRRNPKTSPGLGHMSGACAIHS